VQDRDSFGLLRHQVHVQDIRKEMVIAIPVTLVVQRNEEEVAPL
jgi:hypothetical protein